MITTFNDGPFVDVIGHSSGTFFVGIAYFQWALLEAE